VIGTGTAAAAVTTATTALNIDASAVANAITLVGNSGANILIGGAGNDTLDGGAGNDLLDGGEGSDTYLYGATANYGIEESISDFGTSDTDTIQISAASGSLVLRDDTTGIEQVVITGAAAGVDASAVLNALNFTGGSGANVIKGTAFADVFTGGAGADNMSGNGGNDVFILNTAAEGTGDVITGGDGYDTVRFLGTGATATTNTLTIAATTNVEEIEISDLAGLNTGTAALNINAAAVTASGIRFTGNAGANTITGGSGADIIEGGAGNDILNGGGGNDAILVGNGTDHVTGEKIDGGAGTADTVRFTSTTADRHPDLLANTVGIERVEISDAAGDTSGTTALNVNASAVTVALTITGNDGANTITGTNAADTINAGGGDDIIIVSTAASHGAAEAINGGAGSDTLRYASTTAGETLTTTGLTGMENIVIGTAGGLTTGTTALNVDASNSGSALAITGNDGVNTLTGSSFSDTLNGNAGADVLNGGGGNDTLDGGADSDIMNGAEGDDSFRDVNMGDQIYGGAGNDALSASTAMPDFNLTDLDIGGATTVNLVERIDLTAAGANVLLTFVAADIEAIVGAGGTLVIDADSTGDELFSTEDWGSGSSEGAYTRYSNGGVHILVTSTVGFGKTFTGTTGADNFIGSNSPDTFLFTYLTLNNDDTLDGGVNTAPPDRIIITGGNLVNFLASTATINGIEVIQIGDNLDTQLVLRNGAITVSPVTGFGNGNNTITLGNGSEAQSVTTGSGNDTINIVGTNSEALFTVATGAGSDTLAISGGGSVNMLGGFAGLTGIDNVSIGDTATTLIANNDALAITAGNGGNAITLGSGTQSVTSGSGADSVALGSGTNIVNTGDGSDTVTGGVAGSDAIDLQGGDDTYTLDASSTGGTVSGGTGGSDTLAIGIGVTATILLGEVANATINGVGYSNFDNLSATGANGALTVTAAAGGSTITTGSAGDNVTAGASADNITTGGGADTVNITSGSYANDTLDGGADTDTLAITGGGTVNMNLATISGFDNVSINNTSATTFITDTDNLVISVTGGNAVADITLSATGTQNLTITGTGADIVTLASGSGANGVNTGGGADTVNGAVEAGDVVDLDADNDTFEYRTIGGDVRGGAGTDTITVLADAGVVSLDLTVGTGNGNYSGFENISAAGANGAITAKAVSTGSTITTGSAGDNVTAGGSADAINTGAGNDSVNITSSTYIGDTLNGGDDTDTLAITGGNTVNMTLANITNFESVTIDGTATTFTANGLDLAISAGGGGNTITLGTGTQNVTITGTGADTVTLGSGNNNVNTGGGADTVIGDVALGDLVNLDAGNDNFDYRAIAITGDVRGGAGTDTITVLADAGAVNLNLNATSGNGVYSGFENISASGANGVITATALATGSTITTGTANDDVTAGGAADSISTGDGDDTVRITSSTYANDTLTGGNNTGAGDTLAITGGGTVDLSAGVTVSGFEKVTIDNSVANVFTAHDAALAITVSGGSVGANITLGDGFAQGVTISGTGNDTVVGGSGVNNINTGDGSDTVTNVGASDVVDLGAGSDTFGYQILGTASVHGGDGTDTITYTGGGSITIDLSATTGPGNYSGFENVTVTGTGSASIIASDGGSTIATGSGIDELTTGIGIDNFNTGAGDDTINITSLTYSGDTLDGGDDTDTLSITGGDSVDISTGVTVTNFEDVLIDNTATTFKANNLNLAITAGDGGNTITLGSGTQSVISGAGADTVTLGGGANNVNTGGGSDTVSGGVGAGDIIDLGAGTDSYAFQTLATGTSVSGGDDSDTLVYSGSADQVIDFLTTGDNIAAENGTYSNFENLTATTSAGFLIVTAAAAGGTINTGTGNDTITLGAGIDLVNTGAGSDSVFGAVGINDNVNLAGADDTFAYQALTLGGTVDGGTSTDTLTYTGSANLTIDFTATNDNIVGADVGIYKNFENLLAGSASGDLTVKASTGGSTIATGIGADTVTMGAGTDFVSTGDGIDEVIGTLSAGETINLGGDDDNYAYQATVDSANVIDAAAGTGDNLTYSGGTSLVIDFSAVNDNISAEAGSYRNFENFLAAGSLIGNYIVTAADTGSIIETGSGTDVIHLNDNGAADTVDAGGASDTVDGIDSGDDVDLGADADTAVFSTVTGATISGGTGGTDSDTLQIDSTLVDMTIDLNAVGQQVTVGSGVGTIWQEFENLDADDVGVDDNLTVFANASGSTINTGSGDDNVTLGAGIDTVNVGDGSDTVNNIGDGDTVNLGAGDDTAYYSAAINATIDGGTHNSGDTLIITSTAAAMELNLSLEDLDQVLVGGATNADWKNFENLDASAVGVDDALTVTASAVAGTYVYTGSAGDSVTLGAADQTVSTNGGNDTIHTTGANLVDADIDGGTGTLDILDITDASANMYDADSITGIERVTLSFSGTTFTADTTANLEIIGSTGGDTITLNASTQSVSAGTGDDVIVATNALLNGAMMTLDGGTHTSGDTLRVTDNAMLDDEDFTNVSGIENLVLLGTGVQHIGTITALGAEAEAAGIVSIDASAATGSVVIHAQNYVTAGLTITSGSFGDDIQGGGGNDTLNSGLGDDQIYAGAGADIISGGAGHDYIEGDAGADAMTGGADNDMYAFSAGDVGAGESITEAAAGGLDTVRALQSVDFSNMTAASMDEIEYILIANGQTATFTGAQLNGETATINENTDAGTTNLVINVDDSGSLTQNFSGLAFGAFTTFSVTWNAFDDGADTVTIDASGASVGQSIIGTTIADTINGTGLNDIIEGHGGDDTLLGGAGNDLYVVSDSAHRTDGEITDTAGTADEVRFTSTTDAQTLTIYAGDTGLETVTIGTVLGDTSGITALNVDASAAVNALTITGNDGANTLVGTGFNDTINGNAGSDTITGGAGTDTLSGGAGSDTFVVGALADFTAAESIDGGANASGGTDTLRLDAADTYGNTLLDASLSGIEVVSLTQDGTWSLTFADAAYANADSNGDGTADGTITVSAAVTVNGSVTIVAGTSTNTNELVVVGANLAGDDTVTVGVGTDTISTGAGDDTVNIKSATYVGDTLNGDGNTGTGDTLAITLGGAVNISTGVTGFENVSIDNTPPATSSPPIPKTWTSQVSGGDEDVTINLGATGAQEVVIKRHRQRHRQPRQRHQRR
jgi:Ca2+-binding RTX toxin-like protein